MIPATTPLMAYIRAAILAASWSSLPAAQRVPASSITLGDPPQEAALPAIAIHQWIERPDTMYADDGAIEVSFTVAVIVDRVAAGYEAGNAVANIIHSALEQALGDAGEWRISRIQHQQTVPLEGEREIELAMAYALMAEKGA